MKSVYALMIALAISASAFAGNENGNGGDAVVCRDGSGKILSAELLDYYEARVMRGIEIDLGGANVTMEHRLYLALKRIQRVGPLLGQRLEAMINTFRLEARWIPGIELVDIPDSQETFIPHGCKVEQAAVQTKPMFPEDSYYTINKDIWDRMDSTSQAGLILHEVLYRYALNLSEPPKNSVNVRYLNSYISSRKIEALSQPQYLDLLRRLALLGPEIIQGVTVFPEKMPKLSDYNQYGFVEKLEGPEVIFRGKSMKLWRWQVVFYPTGELKYFTPEEGLHLSTSEGVLSFVKSSGISFYRDGSVQRGETQGFVLDRDNVHMNFSDAEVAVVRFWEGSGTLESVTASGGMRGHAKVLINGMWLAPVANVISFYENGRDVVQDVYEALERGDVKVGRNVFSDAYARYCFWPNEPFYMCGVEVFKSTEVKAQDQKVLALHEDAIQFHRNGNIRSLRLESEATLNTRNGKKPYPSRSMVHFDEDEFAIE